MTLLYAILIVISSLAPMGDAWGLTAANETVLTDSEPVFVGDASRLKSLSLVMAIQYRESGFRDVPGDCRGLKPGDESCDMARATSFCPMQLHGERFRGISTLECVRQGYALIRTSFHECKELPANERLAYYARGSCDSAEGRRISRDRFHMAEGIKAKLEHAMKGTP